MLTDALLLGLTIPLYCRKDILHIGIIEVLAYLHDNCQDRNAWEIAEKAIDLLHELTLQMQKKQNKGEPSSPSVTEGTMSLDVKPVAF